MLICVLDVVNISTFWSEIIIYLFLISPHFITHSPISAPSRTRLPRTGTRWALSSPRSSRRTRCVLGDGVCCCHGEVNHVLDEIVLILWCKFSYEIDSYQYFLLISSFLWLVSYFHISDTFCLSFRRRATRRWTPCSRRSTRTLTRRPRWPWRSPSRLPEVSVECVWC